MKTIESWAAMQFYGIVPLTTEPDGLQYRIVCDVTARGKKLVEKAIGVVEIQLEKNWTHGPDGDPYIGSILLSPELFSIIGVYALFDDGCREVWMTRNWDLVGIQQCDSRQTVYNLQMCYGHDLVHCFQCTELVGNLNPQFLS